MTDEHNPRAEIGGNQPPANEFEERLEAQNEGLLDLEMDLELKSGKLPHEVQSDEDAAAITRWVTQARDVARDVEASRVETKAPYLEREKQIDGWFGRFKARLLAKAKEIEQRSTPYLQAKLAREEAEARARAAAAREAAQRREAEAQEARRAEQAAAEARRRQEEEVRAAARKSEIEAAAAERRLREAAAAEAAAAKARETADTSHRMAAMAEERAEKRAENPGRLGKAAGGGGNARVVMVPGFRIVSMPKLMQSMGPLNSYMDQPLIDRALGRWCKDPNRGEIPGVEYLETPETKTSATRPGHYVSERDG